MNGTEQLSLKDITFLRAIRDINGSPERFASTEQGVTPATVTAITEATTLSEDEVAYRLDHPRLGKSGLLRVYEAGPPGHDSASLNSAELTEAGERAIAEAEEGEASVHTADRSGDADRSEFDDMQEWEPANVESGGAAEGTTAADGVGGGGTATASSRAEPTTTPRTERPSRPTAEPESVPTATEEAGSSAGVDADDDRLAALEARIDQLEAEQEETAAESDDELVEEVASLRESTDRLADQLDDALDRLDAIEESEYGALDEKREQQFETAVKSMVAFHQLATEVLDVRVENYEPSAGRADPERVQISRNRIGDALGVGQNGGGGGSGGVTLGSDDDGGWPDPEEAAAGGRVFSSDGDEEEDAEDEADDEPELESDAPDTGVYPPIGGSDDDGDEGDGNEDSPRETVDDADDPETESDAPDSGVYPPIGEDREEEGTEDEADDDTSDDGSDVPDSGVYPPTGGGRDDQPDGSLPASMQPDADEESESITEAAAQEGHVVDPIRSTGEGGDDADEDEELPFAFDPAAALATWQATHDVAKTEADTDGSLPLPGVDAEESRAIREAITGPARAYARIVDPQPSRDSVTDDDD